ncbi:radical SAM protein [Candidatus Bathyarchaeota archaeon]|nr:radical SAM protein [Candidatus Bathyarchaeota archaeon]
MFYIAERNFTKCKQCGICSEIVACSAGAIGLSEECIGCKACYLTCPNYAIEMKEKSRKKEVKIKVDGESFFIPGKISIKKALEIIGFKISKLPDEGDLFVPCEIGGCYCCAVKVNEEIKPSCVTGVKNGDIIETKIYDLTYKRQVHGWMGHSVGGVGTPWWLKSKTGYIEAAAFTCGCNLRCPQCQNWTTTYNGRETPLTPKEAALLMTEKRRKYGVDRMAISGGESTLNKPWLIQYIKELKKLNSDSKARFHVDTNSTILTKDYIDELIEAGVTDIGPDLKGLCLETFMKITGLKNRELAEKYHQTAWEAVKYIVDKYKGRVFIGVGIPYNKELISIEEIEKIGDEIYKIDFEIQVCVLDYRPEFRSKILRPSYEEMVKIWKLLKNVGLKTVICQTQNGYIYP